MPNKISISKNFRCDYINSLRKNYKQENFNGDSCLKLTFLQSEILCKFGKIMQMAT